MHSVNRTISFLVRVSIKSGLRKISTSSPLCNTMLKYNINALANKTLLDKYMDLPLPECISMARYIWIDGTGEHMRAKTRTLDFIPKCVQELPMWTYDGSSTFQASTGDSEIYICPRAMYNDPLRRGNNKLVLCDTYDSEHKPTKTNFRSSCQEAMDCVCDQEPWFGIEQEFIMLDIDGRPLGWPSFGYPAPQGKYYCGVGADKVVVREVIEAHYRACLFAGIQIGGSNAEVLLSQWEFQIGPGLGIKCADDLWMARYLLHTIAEEYGIVISLDPKPVQGDWNGSGGHCNFSTKKMRCDDGIKLIEQAIQKLAKKHAFHLERYDPKGGDDNHRRLTGRHETASFEKFNSGVGARNVSVRIPKATADAKKGYLEDRRPAANADPYRVCEALVRTCLLE